MDASGNWRITGRLKNLIILNSGHNIAPEPIEEELFRAVPGAQQVMLVGNGRSFLAAIITGAAAGAQIDLQLERVNGPLPHYRKIRKYHVAEELFTIENGLLTANGKLRRDVIAARFAGEIERMPRPKDEHNFPEEVVAELRVLATRDASCTALVTQARREIELGDVAVARKGY